MHTTTRRVVVALLLVVLPEYAYFDNRARTTLYSSQYALYSTRRIILLQYSRVVILFPITCVYRVNHSPNFHSQPPNPNFHSHCMQSPYDTSQYVLKLLSRAIKFRVRQRKLLRFFQNVGTNDRQAMFMAWVSEPENPNTDVFSPHQIRNRRFAIKRCQIFSMLRKDYDRNLVSWYPTLCQGSIHSGLRFRTI